MQRSERTALLLFAAVVAVLFAVPLLGGGGTMMHAYGYGMTAPYTWTTANGWGLAGLIVMALGMLVFWGAVIAGVVLLARAIAPGSSAGETESPSEVLRRRFAPGEITETE